MPPTSPLEQLIGQRLQVRVGRAPSLLMTTLIGGAIGAAIGIATGDKALRFSAIGAAVGLAGSFTYSLYNTRAATEQALSELAASKQMTPASIPRAARPPAGPAAPHHAGYADGPWWG